MNKTNFLLKICITLFAISMILTACGDSDDPQPNGPQDITIPINENSAFNMKNFAASFDQMFMSNSRNDVMYTHVYDNDGKALESQLNFLSYGRFGKIIFTTKHRFDSKGIIISSSREDNPSFNNNGDVGALLFEYEYDKDGYIIKLRKKRDGIIKDVVDMAYNAKKQLITKTHSDGENKGEIEIFTYNEDGTVASYENEGQKTEYTYVDGKMQKEAIRHVKNGSVDSFTYEYDSEGRIKKANKGADGYFAFEFNADSFTKKCYDGEELPECEYKYGEKLTKLTKKVYSHDSETKKLSYCIVQEYNEKGQTAKKHYKNGSIDNLVLIGYSTIDSRDAAKRNYKTKESVFDKNDTKLYYIEFTYANENGSIYPESTKWFKADGTSVEVQNVENWVLDVVRD